MATRSDPLAYAADDSLDLHGIATWEPRSLFDRFLARYMGTAIRIAVVSLGAVLFAGVLLLFLVQVILNPGSLLVVVLFPVSVVPALVLAGYVWYTDITSEPLLLIVATFLLGIVLSTFPLVVNTTTTLLVGAYVPEGVLRFLANSVQHYLVVAPGEEAAKLGAVFAYAYWKDDFDTVVDGAVYGAVAGLGFATIENISYIIQVLAGAPDVLTLIVGGSIVTVLRSIAGPGHVIWTALAGYYLGLAKFNEEYAVALVVKGWLLAVLLHGTYNTALGAINGVFDVLGGISPVFSLLGLLVVVGFVLVYHLGAFGYLFLRLRRYRKAYAAASPGPGSAAVSDLEGFDDGSG